MAVILLCVVPELPLCFVALADQALRLGPGQTGAGLLFDAEYAEQLFEFSHSLYPRLTAI